MSRRKKVRREREPEAQKASRPGGWLGKGDKPTFFTMAFFVFMGIGLILSWGLSQSLVKQARDSLAQEAFDSLLPPLEANLTAELLISPMQGESYRQFKVVATSQPSPARLYEIWNDKGILVYSQDERNLGGSGFPGARLMRILDGARETEIVNEGNSQALRILAPVKVEGQNRGVIDLRRDYAPLARLEGKYTWTLYSTILGVFFVLYIGLVVSINRGLLRIKG